ncbi:MAG: flavodoxin-dependent (E)-4-hydroxy-3-methylbut-2-enyl-diphosphate synthase [Bacillota bacterium]
MERRISKQILVGNVPIGGGAPVVIQSMTNTSTADAAATVAQIKALAKAGCQIVRCTVPDETAAAALPRIIAESPLPVIADIHFDYKMALAAIEAGVHGLRLNPGNIGGAERVRLVASAAKAKNIPIRVGVNTGSLEKEFLQKYGGVTADAMVESAMKQVRILEEQNFDQIKISLKASNVPLMLEAYHKLASVTDYPFHIGVTEAGTVKRGSIKSSVGIGALLAQGIGDTVRVSLAGNPVEEIFVAKEILRSLGLYDRGAEFIVCPTCGRTKIQVEKIASQVEALVEELELPRMVKIAVMGCVVNGPGEAREADIGIAGGDGEGLIFRKGQIVGKYPQEQLVDELMKHLKAMI